MKTHNLFRLALTLLALAFALPLCAHAADAVVAAPKSLPDTVVAWLIPILVPALIALVKKFLPSVPSWALPIMAPVLGLIIGVIDNLAAGHSTNVWVAAGLGLLGVAVREVKEAIKPAANGGWPTP